jgi:hypothetical protein
LLGLKASSVANLLLRPPNKLALRFVKHRGQRAIHAAETSVHSVHIIMVPTFAHKDISASLDYNYI